MPFRQDLIRIDNAHLLHPSHETFRPLTALEPFLNRFYGQRDHLAQRETIPRGIAQFAKTRTYFIPGFLNHSPHPKFLTTLSHASEHGLGFVSVSDEAHYFEKDDYTVIGGKAKVYHPDWRQELATVIKRIFVDLAEQEAKGMSPQSLIVIGHSKGGLLAHSLAAFVKAEKTGQIERLRALYPGMADMPDNVLQTVLTALDGAFYLAIGTPFDGLDQGVIEIAQKYGFERLFGKSADFFTQEFLDTHYDALDLLPDDPDHGIHAVITGQPFHSDSPVLRDFVRRARQNMRPSKRSVFYHGGLTLYDLGVILLGSDLNHDALVAPSKRGFPASLHLTGHNHVTLVGPETPETVVQFIRKHRTRGINS